MSDKQKLIKNLDKLLKLESKLMKDMSKLRPDSDAYFKKKVELDNVQYGIDEIEKQLAAYKN